MFAPFVISIGEAMLELRLDPKDAKTAALGVAGDTLNTAIYLKRLLPNARIAYLTKLGHDPHSKRILTAMRDEELDTSLILESSDKIPGLYAISTDAEGERSFTYWRDASAARDLLRPPALTVEMIAQADLVYLSAISLAILPQDHRAQLLRMLADYRARGGQVAFDSNYRPRLWEDAQTARKIVQNAWTFCDIALPSLDDEEALFGPGGADAVLDRLRKAGAELGALKRGASGPVALSGLAYDCTPVSAVVDSTAAGDSFNAGYLAAYLRGDDEHTCLRAGHALASAVIQKPGAIIPRKDMP